MTASKLPERLERLLFDYVKRQAESWEGVGSFRMADEARSSLVAELAKMQAVVEAARDIRNRWEGALCIVTTPCGNCNACLFVHALSALDAADDEAGT